MIQNKNQLTSLPFYTDLRYQDRNKWWVDNLYKLISPNKSFLPFQIVKQPTTGGVPVECPPVPGLVEYTANWATDVDGWSLDDPFSTGATLFVSGGELVISVPAGKFGAVVSILRKITTDDYTYESSIVNTSMNATATTKLYSYNLISCDEFLGTAGAEVNGGLLLSRSCTGDTPNDVLGMSFLVNSSSATTITLSIFDIDAVPKNPVVSTVIYLGDFSSSVDGWAFLNATDSVLDNELGTLRCTFNTTGQNQIRRMLNLDITGSDRIDFAVNANVGRLVGLTLTFKRANGTEIRRSAPITAPWDFIVESAYIFEEENTDYVELISAEIDFDNDGSFNIMRFDLIRITKVAECVEPLPNNLWVEAKLVNAETEAEEDILTYMNAYTVGVDFDDYQVAVYKGTTEFLTAVDPGYYYLKLTDTQQVFYSEVFAPCGDTDTYLRIDWWREVDLIYTDGRIAYTTGYINTMFLDSDLGKSFPEYQIEETPRSGYNFKEKVVSYKKYVFDSIVPEVVVDVLSRLPNHEYITVTSEAVEYRLTDVEVKEPDYEEKGDLAVLAIEFQSDTIINSITSVSATINELFANESEAINIRGNNKRIYQLGDTLNFDDLYLAADKSGLSEAVRVSISALTQNAALDKENISTGVLHGMELTINSGDPSTFDIATGEAVIVDSHTDPSNPTITFLSWSNQVALPVDNIGTQLVTYVYLDSFGNFLQRSTSNSVAQNRTSVEVGVLVHENLTTISRARSLPNWVLDTDLKVLDLAGALGRINVTGNRYYANGSNLKLDKTSGESYAINANYGFNKQQPNNINSDAETDITFLTAYGGSNIGSSNTVDTVNYDPGGAGTLVPMPPGAVTTHGIFFSPTAGLTIVHYGQFLYDSVKEAVESWEKEDYNIIPELEGVPVMGVLAFVAGATDLSDPVQAKIIKPGAFGIKSNTIVPEYSRYASPDRALAGLTYRRQEVAIVEDSGTIYAEIERLGGGDMVYIFGDREYLLDCTTGAGTGGKARVALTVGTATAPQVNWVYATPTTGNGHAVLNASTSYPSGEIAFVSDHLLQDIPSFLLNGDLSPRRWTDAKEFDGRGIDARTNEWVRRQPAAWESGVLQSVVIDTGASPDSVIFSSTGGIVWQKHRQNFPAINIATSGIYIANHPTAPYSKITDLNDPLALVTSDGTSMSDTRFNWVVWGSINKSTGECKLFLNLPVSTYSIDQNAVDDPNRSAVVTVPEGFRGKAFLIARMPMRHRSPGGGTYENLALSINGTAVVELRGLLANVAGGASSPSAVNAFEDALFNIYNTLSGFNFRFDASNLTADRILDMPDSNGTMALTSDLSNSGTTAELQAGDRVVPTGFTYSDTNYDLLYQCRDTNGYEVLGARLVTKAVDSFTLNLPQACIVSFITN